MRKELFHSGIILSFLILLATHPFVNSVCEASDEPFTGPANWGGTGLLETPTARVMQENRFRVGAGQIHPYRYYYIQSSPLKGLEVGGRVTEIIGVKALSSGYGDYKDKALDLKYQFLSEGKYGPALSFGIMDPQGTRLYASQYIAASKQVYPFDFTLGFGNGRYGKRPIVTDSQGFQAEIFTEPKSWFRDSQFFWGIQFAASEKFALMMEYSPIRYEIQTQDPAQSRYFTDPPPSRFNYGLRLKPWSWTEITMSYQRGDTIGLNLSLAFDIGQPLVPIYDRPYKEKQVDKSKTLHTRLLNAVRNSGFSNIVIDIQNNDLLIEAQNDTYFYSTRAIGVILELVNDITPPSIHKVEIVLTNNLVPIIKLSTTRLDISELNHGKLTLNEFLFLSQIDTSTVKTSDSRVEHRRHFDYGFAPAFRMFLNDPSGFLKYRLGASVWGSYNLWRGGSFIAGFEGFPLNTVSSSNEPTSEPVRSDIVTYQKNRVSLNRLMYNQIVKTGHNLYGKLALGLLEIEYAGVDSEVAMPLRQGRFMMGLSASAVKKRDPDNAFKLSNDYPKTYTTAFLNTRLNVPEYEMSFDIKAGRFLAGDAGARLTVFKFIKGVTVAGWYSWTDTSMFTDSFNKGYHDKGIMVVFPLRLFRGSDSKTTYSYSLSPWTRDVAQDIDHYNTLFDLFGRNSKIYLDKDKAMMYK